MIYAYTHPVIVEGALSFKCYKSTKEVKCLMCDGFQIYNYETR